jgi:uncharacterized Zn-binding protein involved in type VI secretion
MPAISRKGGTDTISTGHGCDATTVTNQGSDNVRVNGIGVVRIGDLQQTHLILVGISCVPHALTLSSGSSTVRANGRGIGRKGDSYGPETLTTGSENVFAGG